MTGPAIKPPRRVPLGGLTEAGRIAEFQSPLQQAIRHSLVRAPVAPAPSRPSQGSVTALTPLLVSAARQRSQGNLAQAGQFIRTALRLDPANPAVQFEMGQIEAAAGRLVAASVAFRNVIATAPNHAEAWRQLGATLDAQGDAAGAIDALLRAVSLAPRAADVARRLSVLLAESGRVAEAIACLDRAADAQPRTLDGRLARARAFLLGRRYDEAEQAVLRALATAPRNPRALLLLGEISGLRGRFEQARRSFRHLIEVAPKDGRAYFNLVHVGRIADQDRPLIARIEAMLNGGDLNEDSRMRLLFALGKAYDDLDEPARAMRAFDAANAIRARLFAMDRGAYEEFASWLMRRFSVQALRSRMGSGSADERPVLILGMPRSGTTLAEQIVSSHPAVAAGDELSFWGGRGHALRGSAPGNDSPVPLAALATDYSALLSDISRTALRITDKNPYNFFWIGLIHLAFPNARFIHCRRNPVATCLSIYMTHFSTKAEFSGRREDLVFYFQLYERLMAHWRTVLPADRIMDLDYEAMAADREEQTRRLIAFCGLQWDDACLVPERNQRPVHTASVWQARQPVYTTSVDRWRRYEPWLGELVTLQT